MFVAINLLLFSFKSNLCVIASLRYELFRLKFLARMPEDGIEQFPGPEQLRLDGSQG
jgi:hypothetical protein